MAGSIDNVAGAREQRRHHEAAMGVIAQSVLLIQIKTAATGRPLPFWLGVGAIIVLVIHGFIARRQRVV